MFEVFVETSKYDLSFLRETKNITFLCPIPPLIDYTINIWDLLRNIVQIVNFM